MLEVRADNEPARKLYEAGFDLLPCAAATTSPTTSMPSSCAEPAEVTR